MDDSLNLGALLITVEEEATTLGELAGLLRDERAHLIQNENAALLENLSNHRSVRFGVVTGHEANDFRDRRDRVAGELARLTGVSAGHYLSSLVGKVSEGARIAVDFAEGQTELLQQVESQRQTTSRVSLDEEAAELLIAQRALHAAAKVVDTLDSMLETVIVTMAS